jgi:hypothetical protein
VPAVRGGPETVGGCRDNEPVTDTALATAHCLLEQAADAVSALAESGSDDDLIAVLGLCEGAGRRLDRTVVHTVAALERRGVFTERGYRSTAGALADLLGWERFEARRRVLAAEQVSARVGVDGAVLPARLPATAAVFAAGGAGLRHVEAIARVLRYPAAQRLSPEQWAGVEEQLAATVDCYTPSELQTWGAALVEALDQDGAEPDDRPPVQVNELHLTRIASGGGKIRGHFDDAAMFDAIATVVDAKARPVTGDDDRRTGQRQAEALADACGYVLDHAGRAVVPDCGGAPPAPQRADPARGPAEPGPGRQPRSCRPGLPAGAADAVLRRHRHPDRPERRRATARRRPRDPDDPGRVAPCGGRPGQRLCRSGL